MVSIHILLLRHSRGPAVRNTGMSLYNGLIRIIKFLLSVWGPVCVFFLCAYVREYLRIVYLCLSRALCLSCLAGLRHDIINFAVYVSVCLCSSFSICVFSFLFCLFLCFLFSSRLFSSVLRFSSYVQVMMMFVYVHGTQLRELIDKEETILKYDLRFCVYVCIYGCVCLCLLFCA